MLVLTRKVGDVIAIGDNIKIVVMAIKGKQVRLGVQADRNTVVHREEIYQKIQQEIKAAMQSDMGTTKVAGEMLKNAQAADSSSPGQPQSVGGPAKKAEPSKLSSGGAGGGTGVFRRVEIRRAAQPPTDEEEDFDSEDTKPNKR
jgi:carbon storage regulator